MVRGGRQASVYLAVAVVVALFGVALALLPPGDGGSLVIDAGQVAVWLAAFTVVGAFVALRVPGNPVGWLCLAIALSWSASLVAEPLLAFHERNPDAIVWVPMVFAVAHPFWVPGVALVGFVVLLFPDGHLPTPFARVVAWLLAVSIVVLMVTGLVQGDYAGVYEGVPWENPLAVDYPEVIAYAGVILLISCLLAAAAVLVGRFRRSEGVERMQLKWLTTAGAIAAGGYLVFMVLAILGIDLAFFHPQLLFALVPVGVGLAVLRYRLYDIDRIVSRTVAYAVVVAVLAAAYAGLVVTLRSLTPFEGALPVAVSTLAMAFAFLPLVRRVQRVVDRRFNRFRYDAARVLGGLVDELQASLDPADIAERTRVVVTEVFSPRSVAVWVPGGSATVKRLRSTL